MALPIEIDDGYMCRECNEWFPALYPEFEHATTRTKYGTCRVCRSKRRLRRLGHLKDLHQAKIAAAMRERLQDRMRRREGERVSGRLLEARKRQGQE